MEENTTNVVGQELVQKAEEKLMDAGQTLITVPLVTAEAVPERSFRHGWQSVLREWPLAAGE